MKILALIFWVLLAGNIPVGFAQETNSTPSRQTNTPINTLNSPPQSIAPANGTNTGFKMPPEDAAFLKAQGWTDAEIAGAIPAPKQQQPALPPTPADLKNALIYLDDFLGGGKTGLPADVISIKNGALKFRFGGKDYDYSGNFSILLTKPRQHKNPYFGLGSPETAKFLVLNGFAKGEPDETMVLPNPTIWEKSDGFIIAVAVDKEWIHSGNYTIQN